MRQIHVDLDAGFWNSLVLATAEWPAEKRTARSICRYAIREYWIDLNHYPENITDVAPAPLGTRHIQVLTDRPTEMQLWADLASEYPSGSAYPLMLRTALAHLHANLTVGTDESAGWRDLLSAIKVQAG